MSCWWTGCLLLVSMVQKTVGQTCGPFSSCCETPPPAFPDMMAFFRETFEAIGQTSRKDFQRSAFSSNLSGEDRPSFCVSKVNLTELNARLCTDDPFDLSSVCFPTSTASRDAQRLTSPVGQATSPTLTTFKDRGTTGPAVGERTSPGGWRTNQSVTSKQQIEVPLTESTPSVAVGSTPTSSASADSNSSVAERTPRPIPVKPTMAASSSSSQGLLGLIALFFIVPVIFVIGCIVWRVRLRNKKKLTLRQKKNDTELPSLSSQTQTSNGHPRNVSSSHNGGGVLVGGTKVLRQPSATSQTPLYLRTDSNASDYSGSDGVGHSTPPVLLTPISESNTDDTLSPSTLPRTGRSDSVQVSMPYRTGSDRFAERPRIPTADNRSGRSNKGDGKNNAVFIYPDPSGASVPRLNGINVGHGRDNQGFSGDETSEAKGKKVAGRNGDGIVPSAGTENSLGSQPNVVDVFNLFDVAEKDARMVEEGEKLVPGLDSPPTVQNGARSVHLSSSERGECVI